MNEEQAMKFAGALRLLNEPDVKEIHQRAIQRSIQQAAQEAPLKAGQEQEAAVDVIAVVQEAGWTWDGSAWVRPPDDAAERSMRVPMSQWGRDHWSTLLFVETRIVDYGGRLDPHRMRTFRYGAPTQYPTRLKDGSYTDDRHDDWACLGDMVAEGMLDGIEEPLSLTDYGWKVAAALRRNRAERKHDKDFLPPLNVRRADLDGAIETILRLDAKFDLGLLIHEFGEVVTPNVDEGDVTAAQSQAHVAINILKRYAQEIENAPEEVPASDQSPAAAGDQADESDGADDLQPA